MKKMTWEDVTLGQYIELQKALETVKGNEMDKTIEFLRILTGKDYSVVPYTEYLDAVKMLDFLKTDIPTVDLPKKIEVNGHVYGTKINVDNITTAQFMDYMAATKIEGGEKLVRVVATFLIPEGKTYGNGYDMEEVIQDAKDMPMLIANSVGFFLRKQTDASLKGSLRYSIFQVLKMKGMSWKNKWRIINRMVEAWQAMVSYRSSSRSAN